MYGQQQRSFVYILYLTGYQSDNSFEELCIMLAADRNSFARVLNPMGERIYVYVYIYIYIYENQKFLLIYNASLSPQ